MFACVGERKRAATAAAVNENIFFLVCGMWDGTLDQGDRRVYHR